MRAPFFKATGEVSKIGSILKTIIGRFRLPKSLKHTVVSTASLTDLDRGRETIIFLIDHF
jgi:hypothetical protein